MPGRSGITRRVVRRTGFPAFWLPACLLALASSTGAAAPEPTGAAAPERAGFTGDLSIGGSLTTRTVSSASFSSNGGVTEDTSTELEPGLAPLGVSLGGYLTPRIALLGRLAGTSYFRGSHQYLQLFAGPFVEYWPRDRWFLAGGIGLGTFTPNPLTGSSVVSPRQGLAFDARAGAVLTGGARHALTLSLEIIPAVYNEFRLGAALVAAWKWY
jgi:hypothetical protein